VHLSLTCACLYAALPVQHDVMPCHTCDSTCSSDSDLIGAPTTPAIIRNNLLIKKPRDRRWVNDASSSIRRVNCGTKEVFGYTPLKFRLCPIECLTSVPGIKCSRIIKLICQPKIKRRDESSPVGWVYILYSYLKVKRLM
jgi:hypothetical protein